MHSESVKLALYDIRDNILLAGEKALSIKFFWLRGFRANLYCFPRCPIATRNTARLVLGAISKQKRAIGIHFCLLPDLFIGGLSWHTGFSIF